MGNKTKGSRKPKTTQKPEVISTTEQMSDNLDTTIPTSDMASTDAAGQFSSNTTEVRMTDPVPMTHEKILRVYRHKVFGKQVMYKVVEGKNQAIGITIVPTFRRYKTMEEQQDGSLIPVWHTDNSMITARTKHYDIDFDMDTFKKWAEQCIVDAINPQFLFKEGNKTVTVRDRESLFGNFDEVMKKARKGEAV